MAHALRVRAALAAADYPAFFALYATAPSLGRALMDVYVPALRFDALSAVVKAFKPSVPLPFLATLLGFVAPQQPRTRAPSAAAHAGADAGTGGAPAAGGQPPAAGAAGKGKSFQAEIQGGASPGESGPALSTGTAAAEAPSAAGEASPQAAAAGQAGEPPPGCRETYFEGDFVARVSRLSRPCCAVLLGLLKRAASCRGCCSCTPKRSGMTSASPTQRAPLSPAGRRGRGLR